METVQEPGADCKSSSPPARSQTGLTRVTESKVQRCRVKSRAVPAGAGGGRASRTFRSVLHRTEERPLQLGGGQGGQGGGDTCEPSCCGHSAAPRPLRGHGHACPVPSDASVSGTLQVAVLRRGHPARALMTMRNQGGSKRRNRTAAQTNTPTYSPKQATGAPELGPQPHPLHLCPLHCSLGAPSCPSNLHPPTRVSRDRRGLHPPDQSRIS